MYKSIPDDLKALLKYIPTLADNPFEELKNLKLELSLDSPINADDFRFIFKDIINSCKDTLKNKINEFAGIDLGIFIYLCLFKIEVIELLLFF